MAREAKAKSEAAKHGLASRTMIAGARPGAVYRVKDEAVALPESRIEGAPPRTIHLERRVIVVQAESMARASSPSTLLVVPCSASQKRENLKPWDFEIPIDEAGFSKEYVVAFTSLVQPILKSDLAAWCGQLTEDSLARLQRRLLENLGLAEPVVIALPPRVAPPSRDDTAPDSTVNA